MLSSPSISIKFQSMSWDFSSFAFRSSLLIYPPNPSGPCCCVQRFCAQTNLAAGQRSMAARKRSSRPPREEAVGAAIGGLGRDSSLPPPHHPATTSPSSPAVTAAPRRRPRTIPPSIQGLAVDPWHPPGTSPSPPEHLVAARGHHQILVVEFLKDILGRIRLRCTF